MIITRAKTQFICAQDGEIFNLSLPYAHSAHKIYRTPTSHDTRPALFQIILPKRSNIQTAFPYAPAIAVY